jgi:hypothetical protein
MIDWNDCTPLTRKEFDGFINAAIPHLQSMEMKNGWDFFVNDMGHVYFCQDLMWKAFRLNDYENYQVYYQKVQDMLTIYQILVEADWSEEDETLRRDKGSEIWRLVLNKVNAIADEVF